jgi:hypothetical protein
MNLHVRDSLVTGYEHLVASVELPDPDDRHVVAAAIQGGANLIVTFNLQDFPAQQLQRYGLVARHRRSLENPPTTADEYLVTLLKQQLTQTVSALRA